MSRIDLNCDLGESFGAYTIDRGEKVIAYISSANAGCGFHAGDPCVMDHTVCLAKEKGASIGVHPGFPDLIGSSRRNINITPAETKAYMKYQIDALNTLCILSGVPLVHIKPYGTLCNMAAKDMKLAMALAEMVYEVDPKLILLGLSDSKMLEVAQQVGLTCASEVLADRIYNADGSPVARGTPGAVIHDVSECVRCIIGMVKDNVVTVIIGEQTSFKPQSICVYDDNAEATESVKHICESLTKEGTEAADLRVCIE